MCGIALVFYKKECSRVIGKRLKILHKMIDQIEHRGIDQISSTLSSSLDISFRRLAITNRKRLITTSSEESDVYFNGEIYNYKELGYNGTEIEVLRQGFSDHGPDFVKLLNGMFFIVLKIKDQVFLLRDRYGIKPCYIYETDSLIIAASEIKSIMQHPEYKFEVNLNAKIHWFVFNNTISDETLFENVYRLQEGSYFHLNSGTKTKYWSWKFNPTKIDYETAVQKVRSLLMQAIKRQTPKEVEYGTCLSGGVDSNIINKCLGDVFTFSAGFSEGNDERNLAELSSKKHYEVYYNDARFVSETIYHLEDLRAGASWSNYGLYELASKYVKVLFDGAGGDELFGGYTWRYDMSKNYFDIIDRTKAPHTEEIRAIFNSNFNDTIENRFRFDAEHFLPAVLNAVDKLSMAHTIEVRLPFLDNDLVDFCLTLPNEFKENKKILKDAFIDLLHPKILSQPKMGFSSPDYFKTNAPGNQALRWAAIAYTEWEKQFNKQSKKTSHGNN